MCVCWVVERRAVESVRRLRAFDAALWAGRDLGQVERACWRGSSTVLSPSGAGRYRRGIAHCVCLVGLYVMMCGGAAED